MAAHDRRRGAAMDGLQMVQRHTMAHFPMDRGEVLFLRHEQNADSTDDIHSR
jgi:hypothetical protein